MRAVVQRVNRASVTVSGETVGEIKTGFLVLLGIKNDDTEADLLYLVDKISNLRVFEDAEGRLNLSLLDTGGSALVISNFTLYADARKGRRPGFTDAAPGEIAEPFYLRFLQKLAETGIPVQCGRFGAEMQVSLTNDGPITLLLDSRKLF